MHNIFNIVIILGLTALATACAPSLEGDTYARNDARKTMTVQYGTVQASKAVIIEGDRSNTGKISGAVIGGVSGNAVGSGSGRNISTAVGAVAGSIIGQMAEERMTRAQGVELVILLDSGETIAIIQEVTKDTVFNSGDRVKLITGNGQTRVSR